MRNLSTFLSIAVVGVAFAVSPALAQTKPAARTKPAAAPAETEIPMVPAGEEESSLAVGALQIGSAAGVVVAGIDINVASDSIVYSYLFKNTGSAERTVTAAVSMPELEASADGNDTWVLPSNNPENPVDLTITAADKPVTTKAQLNAYALGIDRVAEIEAEHLPLIPFGSEVDRALAGLSPEAAERLAALGLISATDPAKPRAPLTAAWSLNVVRSWVQVLPPGETKIVVKFTPIRDQYRIEKGDDEDLDEMKDEACLKPQVLSVLQSRLKGNGAWKVTDISLAAHPPARWMRSPKPALSVQKPTPNAIVAFCGMDDKTANQPTVLGVAPYAEDYNDDRESRIVIFEPIVIYEPKEHRR